ncbi:hypothetical protein HYN56_12645 [Flavobacterium crocinum]|uniref:Uncharacterized protein n=1 Tax=Flavobacterium crocinum TaxID=2183896 RepID=A0A2S1YLS3_9FLAO|nr:hypothetical protein [Flavobacterium crocinum]AWK05030.1 hypothetical protein HYN56_12645 [Flavobacterium crocinum]
MPNEFDSHEFIRHFSKKFENDYVIFLNSYEDNSFRNVHLQIGKCLTTLAEDLKTQKKIKKVESNNIFGNEIENAGWTKVN